MTEPTVNGSLSIVVPMEDMTAILTQLWKSRQTEPHVGKLYEKYKALILKNNERRSIRKIEWDLEELKQAYIRNAEEYDRIMKKEMEDDDE